MLIGISGRGASGKTVLAANLAKELKYDQWYTGQVFRDMAAEAGLGIEDFYRKLAENPEAEKAVDRRQAALLMLADNMVIQGRMAPFIMQGKISGLPKPYSKCVTMLLTVSPEEAVRREIGRPENIGRTSEEMKTLAEARFAAERDRYQKLYGIKNHLDPEHFDIVIDTTRLTPDQVLEKTLEELIPFFLSKQ